jgi:DNA-binding beta-propeller fold protein YncE
MEMSYFPDSVRSAEGRVWPTLPDVPRYSFAGQLVGEQNFSATEQSQPGTFKSMMRWVVGLGAGPERQPRVLVRPQSGMVDRQGRILVTDVGRGAIFVFDVRQGKLFIWNQADAGDTFSSPIGITAGANDEILVADADLQRIVRLSQAGQPLGSIGNGQLQRPTGLVRDSLGKQIFVADTRAHQIAIFNDAGQLIRKIGQHGTSLGELNAPTHLSLTNNKLYVTDTLNSRVQIFTAEGEPLTTFGKRGLYVGNLTRPKGVTVDTDGNVYIVESYYDHLLIYSPEGEFLLAIGGTGAAVGNFYLPAGTWSDQQGRIYVADMYNGRVIIFQYLGS